MHKTARMPFFPFFQSSSECHHSKMNSPESSVELVYPILVEDHHRIVANNSSDRPLCLLLFLLFQQRYLDPAPKYPVAPRRQEASPTHFLRRSIISSFSRTISWLSTFNLPSMGSTMRDEEIMRVGCGSVLEYETKTLAIFLVEDMHSTSTSISPAFSTDTNAEVWMNHLVWVDGVSTAFIVTHFDEDSRSLLLGQGFRDYSSLQSSYSSS